VNEQRRDHQVGGPAMDRSDQPAEFNFSDDELNTLESAFRAGPVIEQQENSGRNLNREKKQRHPAEVVPD